MTKIGIFGLGTVGKEVVAQIKDDKNIEIIGLFSRTKKPSLGKFDWFDSWKELVDKSDIVIETVGGIEIARDITFYALEQGKKVVTANKYLLATFGEKLLPKYKNQLRFEATVCSSIPIIKLLHNYYNIENIEEVSGILNGTTNFVLSKVTQGLNFDEAVKIAQDLGFAEYNPTLDIECIDASHKAIILHYILFGKWLSIFDIITEKPRFAKKNEKNITIIRKDFITIVNSNDKKFSGVNDNNNALNIKCKTTGETFISGIGAGGKETAFAVVRDVRDMVLF